jgi:hypothetical protein
MLHFEVPQWLACQGGANYPTTKVVLALGGNDAIFGTPDEVFEQKAREHIIDLVEKGCDLTVIPPPDPIIGSQFDVPFNTKRTILEYVVAEFPTVNYYDMPYNWNSTTDGLHPSEVASFWIGYSIIQELGL